MLHIAHLDSRVAEPVLAGIGMIRVVVRNLSIIRENTAGG